MSSFYMHSKIYIIDDEIAYLGSFNFTTSGVKKNFESRTRITERAVVNDLSILVDQLFHNNKDNYYLDIQKWGKNLYPEPIN